MPHRPMPHRRPAALASVTPGEPNEDAETEPWASSPPLLPCRRPWPDAPCSRLAVAAVALAGRPSLAQTNTAVKVASAGIASDIGFFIAHKKGYFRAEGLDVHAHTSWPIRRR